MRKTRVLLLLHELTRTGAPKVALDAFAYLGGGFDVRMIALQDGPLAESCRAVGILDVLPDKYPRGGTWRRALGRLEFRRWVGELRRWAPDLIYVNSVASLPVAQQMPLPAAPVLLHVHELHTEMAMVGSRELMTDWPEHYIAASEAVARALGSEFGIEPGRVSVIHEFVPERYVESAAPAGRPVGRPLIVGGAGVPSWRKGKTLWLQVAAEVRELLGPSASRFVWVGIPGPEDQQRRLGFEFRREAQLLGLDDMVELVPTTPTPLEHFARFDLFAMTSREDPCPVVVLESMILGIPVLCFSGGGGAPEEVGESGVVIDRFSPREMARRIADLATSPGEIARLGALARDRVLGHFTDRVQVPKIRREIEGLARVRA